MMEGVSQEACSLAGHWGLGKLIAFYDDNQITIDGETSIAFTEDTLKRFQGLGWQACCSFRLDQCGLMRAILGTLANHTSQGGHLCAPMATLRMIVMLACAASANGGSAAYVCAAFYGILLERCGVSTGDRHRGR